MLARWRRIPGPSRDRVKARLLRLYVALERRYGPQRWWPGRTPYEIAVVLPASAAGSDYLYLVRDGARGRSEQPFEVKVAPIILSVDPGAARPGQEVLVRGRWFTDATEILIGKLRSRVLRRDLRGGSILIEVPRGAAPGLHILSARSETLISERKQPFTVLAGPADRPPPRDHRTDRPR